MGAAAVLLYCMMTTIMLTIGTFWLDDKWRRRRGAVAMLTCWAWPLWLVGGLVIGVAYLVKVALGKDD